MGLACLSAAYTFTALYRHSRGVAQPHASILLRKRCRPWSQVACKAIRISAIEGRLVRKVEGCRTERLMEILVIEVRHVLWISLIFVCAEEWDVPFRKALILDQMRRQRDEPAILRRKCPTKSVGLCFQVFSSSSATLAYKLCGAVWSMSASSLSAGYRQI